MGERRHGIAPLRTRLIQASSIVLLLLWAIYDIGRNNFGHGVDGGTHYFFADRLAHHLAWPFAVGPAVGFLAHYPPAAHFLAAVTGFVVHSTLHGMLIVAAIALVVFYFILADFVRGLSPRRSLAYLTVFVLSAIAFRKFRFVVGNEIITNFFFAQFVANAVLIGGLLLASRQLHRSFGAWLAVSAVAVHITGWFYPLSAVWLAIAAAMLRAAPTTGIFIETRKRIIETAVAGIVLCAVAVFHPTILDMLWISSNDGGITISNDTALIITICAVISLVLFYARFYGARSTDADALMALSVGVIAPCVVLGLLLLVGKGGSLYAVKKSFFLVGTLAMMLSSVLVVDAVFAIIKRVSGSEPGIKLSPAMQTAACCLFAAACLPATFAGRDSRPIAFLQHYDASLRNLMAQGPSEEFYGRTALVSSKLSPTENYLIGYPVLRQIRLLAQENLFDPGQPDVSSAKYIVISAADGRRYDKQCIVRASASLMIVKSECFAGLPNRKP